MKSVSKKACTRELAPGDLAVLRDKVRIQTGRMKLTVGRENVLPYDSNVKAKRGFKMGQTVWRKIVRGYANGETKPDYREGRVVKSVPGRVTLEYGKGESRWFEVVDVSEVVKDRQTHE